MTIRPLFSKTESVVVELTATGRGAICVLGVYGEGVPEQLDRFFQAANKTSLGDQPKMKPVYGRWNNEDIIVCVHEPGYIEVHCHGGDFAKQRIIDDLASIGFANGSLPNSEKVKRATDAALLELAKTTTRKTAAILTWQSEGALDRAILKIDELVTVGNVEQARALIDSLLELAPLGLHLTRPWQVAIAGAANAGKSSLINQIVGYGRSIVMDMPGTTRDLVTVETAIDGWPVRLIDTAGLRQTDDQIEQAGLALAKSTIEESDLTIEVIDSANPVTSLDGPNVIRVWNKSDLAQPPESKAGIRIVALTGEGVDELLNVVAKRLVPIEPNIGSPVPFLESHVNVLRNAKRAITELD